MKNNKEAMCKDPLCPLLLLTLTFISMLWVDIGQSLYKQSCIPGQCHYLKNIKNSGIFFILFCRVAFNFCVVNVYVKHDETKFN